MEKQKSRFHFDNSACGYNNSSGQDVLVVELDALPPNVLKELIESSIVNLIDRDRWAHAQKKEAQEEEKVKELKNL